MQETYNQAKSVWIGLECLDSNTTSCAWLDGTPLDGYSNFETGGYCSFSRERKRRFRPAKWTKSAGCTGICEVWRPDGCQMVKSQKSYRQCFVDMSKRFQFIVLILFSEALRWKYSAFDFEWWRWKRSWEFSEHKMWSFVAKLGPLKTMPRSSPLSECGPKSIQLLKIDRLNGAGALCMVLYIETGYVRLCLVVINPTKRTIFRFQPQSNRIVMSFSVRYLLF